MFFKSNQDLAQAIEKGDEASCKKLVENQPIINLYDRLPNENTLPLHHAISCNQLGVFRTLLKIAHEKSPHNTQNCTIDNEETLLGKIVRTNLSNLLAYLTHLAQYPLDFLYLGNNTVNSEEKHVTQAALAYHQWNTFRQNAKSDPLITLIAEINDLCKQPTNNSDSTNNLGKKDLAAFGAKIAELKKVKPTTETTLFIPLLIKIAEGRYIHLQQLPLHEGSYLDVQQSLSYSALPANYSSSPR